MAGTFLGSDFDVTSLPLNRTNIKKTTSYNNMSLWQKAQNPSNRFVYSNQSVPQTIVELAGSGSSAKKVSSGSHTVSVPSFDYDSIFKDLEQAIDNSNSLASASALAQNTWQEKQNAKAMEFNASEAAKNREWQQMMSNTAHQRELADLQAAGLNPVLSASGGNGATVTSGATASGVTSAGTKAEVNMQKANILANLLATKMSCDASVQSSLNSAQAVLGSAAINASASRYVSDNNYSASLYGSNISRSNALTSSTQSGKNAGLYAGASGLGTAVNLIIGLAKALA